jgi:hypothetical protein
MNLGDFNQRFGIYWLFFGYTLALHVLDEAGHDFVTVFNLTALAIRRTVPWLRVPTLTLQEFIGILVLFLALLLALTPLAFRGSTWVRGMAIPIAAMGGILNGLMHILSSIYMLRWMPGVYSAPLILLSGTLLLKEALRRDDEAPAR